ncbi:MAG: GNAT family N-acetyltransferase [Actinomycetota bacterium]|nr:GNAT family N-acetyltransferase [Actinomycetota bacterium]
MVVNPGGPDLADEYEISSDPARFDRETFHHWISDLSYWANGRARETTEAACDASVVFGAYLGTGEMIGCARVVTDGLTFAWLCDVFVDEPYRSRGVGRRLMEAVMEHPGMAEMKRFVLATADAHGLYEEVGFETLKKPERWMIRSGSVV